MNGPQQNELLLEVDGISLWFKGVKAVTDVSFQVGTEELYAIIGPNGAGKTSIFNSISQVYHPQEGDIRWKGESIMGSRPDRVAELGIARTFQNIELFPHDGAGEPAAGSPHPHEAVLVGRCPVVRASQA